METFEITVLALTALFNVTFAFIMHTTNIQSALVFKVAPFFIGASAGALLLAKLGIF